MSGNGYGPVSDGIGTLFWLLAFAFFSSPFWIPVVTFVIGVLFGVSI